MSADPVNAEAEQGLLGAILINNAALGRVADTLQPEHFSVPVHGRIYASCRSLIEQGVVADPVTLLAVFGADTALSELGGAKYLADLAAGAVTVLNAPYYAATIRDLYLRRELIRAAEDLAEAAKTIDVDRPAQDIFDEHEAALGEVMTSAAVRSYATVGSAARESVERTEAAYKAGGKITGIETGLKDLDRLLGGLTDGNLEIIAARPSMGKSSIAGGIALFAARHDCPVVVFSLEEQAAQQAQRLIAMESGVPAARQRRGDLDMIHWQKILDAQHALDRLPLYLDDTPGTTLGQLRRRLRDMRRRRGVKLAIVDHLQLIRAPGNDSRRTEVSDITRSLKELAKELEIPIVLLSQLSRALEARDNKRPMLSDLKESGDIEADADRVIFIHRAEYYLSRSEPERRAEESQEKFNDRYGRWKEAVEAAHAVGELIVAKHRMGPTGTIRVHWDEELTRFSDLARGY